MILNKKLFFDIKYVLFFLSGSQKVYTNLDIDLSANIPVIGFQI